MESTTSTERRYKPSTSKKNEYQIRWIAKHPEEYKEYHREYDIKRYKEKREHILQQKKEYYLRKKAKRDEEDKIMVKDTV